MRKIMLAVIALLFGSAGLFSLVYAGDTKANVEEMKGEVKSDAQKAKGETKAAGEELKG